MNFLRFLWDLLTGRLHARLAQLEQDHLTFAEHYNQHIAFARSKLTALSAHTNRTRAELMSLAERVRDGNEARQTSVQLEAFTDADDESTLHLTENDVEVVMPRARRT